MIRINVSEGLFYLHVLTSASKASMKMLAMIEEMREFMTKAYTYSIENR